MIIPSSWTKLTGWKAVLVAVPILAIIVFKVWNTTPHYRQFALESLDVPSGKSYVYQFQLKRDGKIKAEISEASGGEHLLYIVTESAFKELEKIASTGSGDPKGIPTVIERKGNSDQTLTDVQLTAGQYYLIVENLGDSGIACKLTLSLFQ